ncbi:MAG: hypothetical protein ACLU99_11110 [Alphaproteobacteria bacterium]
MTFYHLIVYIFTDGEIFYSKGFLYSENLPMRKFMKTKDLADMIRKKRKEQKLTQPQLAGLCNVGVRFIVDLESGKETCQIGKSIICSGYAGN